MTADDTYDLVVLGGGTGGLVSATIAQGLGASVALVEKHRTGGDCLWTGCVPSKAIITAAKRAHAVNTANALGISSEGGSVDFAAVMEHVKGAQQTIAPHDSPVALRERGIDVIEGTGVFDDYRTLVVDGTRRLTFRKAIIATGGRPFVPPIEGIEQAEVRTSDDIWDLTELPERLLVVGGGPIGCELGQSFARLGSVVTLVDLAPRIISPEPADASVIVDAALRDDGITMHLSASVARVTKSGGSTVATIAPKSGAATIDVPFDVMLVSIGRKPNSAGLGLEAVGVATTDSGHIDVDDTLQTSTRGIYAVGDVTRRPGFTHTAAHDAGTAVRNAFFPGSTNAKTPIPATTFTDPEISSIGMTAEEAHDTWGGTEHIVDLPHDQLDRAVSEGATSGFTRLVATPKGRVKGAVIVGPRAGEMLAVAAHHIRNEDTIRDVATTMQGYPTWAEGPATAAMQWVRENQFDGSLAKTVGPLMKLMRLLSRR